MRVCLDTNVIVSAFASRGLCADLLELVLLEHDLILGRQVLLELQRALEKKVRLPSSHARAIVEFVSGDAVVVVERGRKLNVGLDPGDSRVVGEALAGDSAVLVTGDRAFLDLREIEGMPLLSPRQFWELVRSGERR